MEYYVKSVIPTIKMNYDRMTNVEKSIADFFIQNREKGDLSSKALSDRLYVSEASLSRFAQKCGYRGYREFIYQYEATFVDRDFVGNTRMVLNVYQELLDKTYALVDQEQIERVSKMLGKARHVLVCGVGSSGYSASEMELRFMRLGLHIDALNDGQKMRMRAIFQTAKDVVIGISLSGESEDVIYMLKSAHSNHAKTILLTSNTSSSFYDFCDEVIITPSLHELNYGNIISPQFPVLLMIDILYAFYYSQDSSQKEKYHVNTVKALKDNELKKNK